MAYRRKHPHMEQKPKSSGLMLNSENATFYGQRGGKRIAPKTYFVEGEWLTYGQIAVRLGTTTIGASSRYRSARKAGDVTWASLMRRRSKYELQQSND